MKIKFFNLQCPYHFGTETPCCERLKQAVERNDDLVLALTIAKNSFKAQLEREGYQWVGADCDVIDAALGLTKP